MTSTPANRKLLDFEGRVAAITGAGRGLGREFALLLARRGAAVVVNDIGRSRDETRYGEEGGATDVAHAVVAEIAAEGGTAIANVADISEDYEARSIVEDAVDQFGRIDIVINNAGILPYAPLEELNSEQFFATLAVHVGGAFHVTRAAWPHFRSSGYGRVVNICSSVGVVYGNDNYAAYASAKGALMGLTRVAAWEGAAYGVVANGLLPNAATRGRASVRAPLPGQSNAADHESAGRAAAAAAWLSHEQCGASGEFFAVKDGSMRQVFMSVAEGFQAADPSQFSPELIRDNWNTIQDRRPASSPTTAVEYNLYRQSVYDRIVPAAR
jgi:NAD(P)-dependent dehydrogenase (short-subunit alcohol dehydrogenase family)